MRHIHTSIHPDIDTLDNKKIFLRHSTRAICLKSEMILMLYTDRYDDYSLPGGGLNQGEDPIEGMKRELIEETGANNIIEIKPFGIYEEYRPWYKPDFEIQHMISYCYTCKVDEQLGDTNLEHYEKSNGMKPSWINIHEAINHNEKTMINNQRKGMSIERETYLLRLIKDELF